MGAGVVLLTRHSELPDLTGEEGAGRTGELGICSLVQEGCTSPESVRDSPEQFFPWDHPLSSQLEWGAQGALTPSNEPMEKLHSCLF